MTSLKQEWKYDKATKTLLHKRTIKTCVQRILDEKIKTAEADAGGGYRYNQICDQLAAKLRAIAAEDEK